MNILDGWSNKYLDEQNDLIVVLASYGGALTAYKNKPSKLYAYIQLEKEREDGQPHEFPEVILAYYGEKIDLETAQKYFPELKDKKFWSDKTWDSYDNISKKEIIKSLN